MAGYNVRKYSLIRALKMELDYLEPHQIERVLHYCRLVAAEQPRLFDDTKRCLVCDRILVKPRRGPMPTYCSSKCRQTQHRRTRRGELTPTRSGGWIEAAGLQQE